MPAKPSGRPPGPLIPCGWCHEPMTTSQLRVHLAGCPERPVNQFVVKAVEKRMELYYRLISEGKSEREAVTACGLDPDKLAITYGQPKPRPDTLTCGDEEEL